MKNALIAQPLALTCGREHHEHKPPLFPCSHSGVKRLHPRHDPIPTISCFKSESSEPDANSETSQSTQIPLLTRIVNLGVGLPHK
jgi:hypothetical protein